jgi:exodeoxyribonuclease-5
LSAGTFGESRVVHRDLIDAEAVSAADQILVGLNRTRRAYNKRMRELLGRGDVFPEPGDKLVCLRNDRKKGLLNGSLWTVSTAGSTRRKKLRLSVVPEDDGSRKPLRIGVLPAFFTSEDEIPYAQRRDSDEFDYGYALTVHKAQGSQWNDVMLFDESGAFREHRNRWLYTGITRAAERLTIVL